MKFNAHVKVPFKKLSSEEFHKAHNISFAEWVYGRLGLMYHLDKLAAGTAWVWCLVTNDVTRSRKCVIIFHAAPVFFLISFAAIFQNELSAINILEGSMQSFWTLKLQLCSIRVICLHSVRIFKYRRAFHPSIHRNNRLSISICIIEDYLLSHSIFIALQGSQSLSAPWCAMKIYFNIVNPS